MIDHAVDSKASTTTQTSKIGSLATFQGFEPLNSNYVYCPNQFFDVCLKSNSRGMVRIVAYILRQTLGWLDENGQPIQQTVKVRYRDLIEKAGVSRGAIGLAIQRAVSCGFLECSVSAKPNAHAQSSQTAEYALRWDNGPDYATTFDRFNGFYAGEGYRTPVPNSFFDKVIPGEQLAVSKVVGTVLRHTIGYQNQFGGRRTTTPISCTYIQKYARLANRRNAIAAIRKAETAGYIEIVRTGVFSPIRSEQSATTYGIRWLPKGQSSGGGSKMTPEPQRFKNDTSNGSKTAPAERFKNDTSIETTNIKNTVKQQVAVDEDFLPIDALVGEGFDRQSAEQLAKQADATTICNQIEWIDDRKPKKRLAMLRKAIQQNWDEPESVRIKKKQTANNNRLFEAAEKLQQEDAKATEAKRQRLARRQMLLNEWGSASLERKAAWISAAANRQTSESIRKIILKHTPKSEAPCFYVLDEIVFDAERSTKRQRSCLHSSN